MIYRALPCCRPFTMRTVLALVVSPLLVLSCEPPDRRRRPPLEAPHAETWTASPRIDRRRRPPLEAPHAETWTASPRTVQQIREACHASVKVKLAKRRAQRERALVNLQTAEARLQAIDEQGNPAGMSEAMKNRDAAAAEFEKVDADTPDAQEIYAECKRRVSADDTHARLEQMKLERHDSRRKEAARAKEKNPEEGGGTLLRVLGAALLGGVSAIGNGPPTTSTPAAPTPVNKCNQCIQQWCSFDCSGIGDRCAPCMQQWCDFEC
jgi:hypothetical protein